MAKKRKTDKWGEGALSNQEVSEILQEPTRVKRSPTHEDVEKVIDKLERES